MQTVLYRSIKQNKLKSDLFFYLLFALISNLYIHASISRRFTFLGYSARHSNQFDVSVNIAAGSNVTFNLIYQELLRRRFGSYEHSVYVNPSGDVREYSIEVFVQERTEIRDVRTPAMRKDIINNAVEEGESNVCRLCVLYVSCFFVVVVCLFACLLAR